MPAVPRQYGGRNTAGTRDLAEPVPQASSCTFRPGERLRYSPRRAVEIDTRGLANQDRHQSGTLGGEVAPLGERGTPMLGPDVAARHREAVAAFAQQTGRRDGAAVVETLTAGLELVGRLFLDRIRGGLNVSDVAVRNDLPNQPELAECYRATLLVEAVESGIQTRRYHYLAAEGEWYEKWLALALLGGELPLKQIVTGIAHYGRLSPERRQADLRVSLERRIHAALDAPPVVYRLLTLAVTVITATAFGDQETADSARHLQHTLVPLAGGCGQCHGQILSAGKLCPGCGNPLWRRDWLGSD